MLVWLNIIIINLRFMGISIPFSLFVLSTLKSLETLLKHNGAAFILESFALSL